MAVIHKRSSSKPAWLMATECNTPDPPFPGRSMYRLSKDPAKVTCKRCLKIMKREKEQAHVG